MGPGEKAKEILKREVMLQSNIDQLARKIEDDHSLELNYVACQYGPIHMFIPDVCIFAYNEVIDEFGSFDPDADSMERASEALGLMGLDWEVFQLACLFVELSILQTYKNPEWDFLEIDPTWVIAESFL